MSEDLKHKHIIRVKSYYKAQIELLDDLNNDKFKKIDDLISYLQNVKKAYLEQVINLDFLGINGEMDTEHKNIIHKRFSNTALIDLLELITQDKETFSDIKAVKTHLEHKKTVFIEKLVKLDRAYFSLCEKHVNDAIK